MASAIRPSIGYVTSRYPQVSHTFVQREILGLRAAGFRVETAAMVPAAEEHLLSPMDRDEADRTMTIRPLTVRSVLRHLVMPSVRHPIAALTAVRTSAHGWWLDPRQLVWRFFYAIEAVMLWSLMEEKGVTHLHAHHANVSANLSWLAAGFGQRVRRGPRSWTFTMHGSNEFVDIERTDLASKAESAAAVACISDFTRSQLMMVTRPSSWKDLVVVHCGVDPTVYHPHPEPASEDQPFTVLVVGRLEAVKGLPLLIEATATLRDDIAPRQTLLLVVGDGEWRDEMAKRCAELQLDVKFTGAIGQHEILPMFHRADVFCITSFREGIPVVLMEAMACGIPCVAPRITAIPELIEDGVSGLLATAGRSDQFAAHLVRLAEDPELSAAMGRAARERVLDDFTTAKTIDAMVDLFDGLDHCSEGR